MNDIATQTALRERRYPAHTSSLCPFHVGPPDHYCKRCTRTMPEHYGLAPLPPKEPRRKKSHH